jgi:RNA polymerase sigma-70 factor, ECF subfamily
MGKENDGVNSYLAKLVRIKARSLIGKPGFVPADVPDIEQELTLDALNRLPRFDPERAKLETFITRIVDHCIATLIESRRAGIRDPGLEEGSIDERRVDAEGQVGETAPVLETLRFLEKHMALTRADEKRKDLEIDMPKALAKLPPDQRRLCGDLKAETISEISARTGVPRATLYDRLRRVRLHLEREGLKAYL